MAHFYVAYFSQCAWFRRIHSCFATSAAQPSDGRRVGTRRSSLFHQRRIASPTHRSLPLGPRWSPAVMVLRVSLQDRLLSNRSGDS